MSHKSVKSNSKSALEYLIDLSLQEVNSLLSFEDCTHKAFMIIIIVMIDSRTVG